MGKFKRMNPPLCACGCGQSVKQNGGVWNKFVYGHNNPMQGRKHSKETLERMAKIKIGKTHTKKTCQKLSKVNTGKKLSAETRRKIATASTGRRHTSESKEKMSIIFAGRIFSEEHRKNISIALTGRKLSEEQIKKIALTNTGKKRTIEQIEKTSGHNHYNWKGGKSCEPYCDAWTDQEYKESIKERDGNQCQNPGCRKNHNHLPLTIHHIDYNKKNCAPQNLITTCVSCNSRANFGRKHWVIFYQKIMSEKYGYKYN